MADYHVRRSRLSSSGSDDFEDESLDPRIQVELEKLNKAAEEINRLELELDDARASFRQTLSESTQKLDMLAKKLGSSVEKARPYYDARLKAKEAHFETQRAALRFERACSMHEAAKEMVQLAEQGYMRREQPSDPAWQEMLNHATMKVNEAEKERNESEQEHQRTMIRFKAAEDQVQSLQKELKRTITKSKPYFELKAKFNQIMEEHKHRVGDLEEDVGSAKSLYSTALRSLEAISDEIHCQRLERRQQQQLGVRGAGVGAECPLPPPSWEKGLSIDGRDSEHIGNCQSMDPLGVIKISSAVSYEALEIRKRSRNVSGESYHGHEPVEAKNQPEVSPANISNQDSINPESVNSDSMEGDSNNKNSFHTDSLPDVLIPGDPLGVLPPVYTSASIVHLTSCGSSSSISHPAFSGTMAPCSTGHLTSMVHPAVRQTHSSQFRTSTGLRHNLASNQISAYVPPSVLYANPEEARRSSYHQAMDASQKDVEICEFPENIVASELNEEYMNLPHTDAESRTVCEKILISRQRSHSNPVHPADYLTRSPPHAIPERATPQLQEALADGRKHGSAPEKSEVFSSHAGQPFFVGGFREENPGSSQVRQAQKLQGLILRIDPTMDPLRNFEPGSKSKIGESSQSKLLHNKSNSVATSVTAITKDLEKESPTPASQPTQSLYYKPPMSLQPLFDGRTDNSSSKSIIRSASTVSATGSERSETEFSEIESVSATQSPTKPRSRLLNVPSSIDNVEDSSDTESLASTGPMLDDDQVEFLTMDFSDVSLDKGRDDYNSSTLPAHLKRSSWSRMSLPPRLSYLEGFLTRAKRFSGEYDLPAPDFIESPAEEGKEELSSHCAEQIPESEDCDNDRTDCLKVQEVSHGHDSVEEQQSVDEAEGEMIVVRL